MSTTITGGLTWADTLTIPSDLVDDRNAASVNVPFQALADRTYHLKHGNAGTYHVGLDSPLVNVSSRFTATFDGVSKFYWRQGDVTDDGGLIWHVPTRLAGRITTVLAYVDGNGAGTNHITIPAAGDLPKIQLLKCAAGVYSAVAAAVEDPSSSLPVYEAVHAFGHFGLTADFGATVSYAVWFRGEKGVNAVPDALGLYQIAITVEPV